MNKHMQSIQQEKKIPGKTKFQNNSISLCKCASEETGRD